MTIWMLFHSQTQAMACRCVLVRCGYRCWLRKPQRKARTDSCAWAVGVSQATRTQLIPLLQKNNLQPFDWREGETP